MLIRSQDRPKGKLIYDSEKYNGHEAKGLIAPPEQPLMPPMESGPQASQALGQFADTKDAEIISAQIGNMYNAPMVADQPYQMTSPEHRRMILKPQGNLNIMNRPNQRYSLEQMRFLNKIKNASKRMNDLYNM